MARTYDDILQEAWDRKCHPNVARAPGRPSEWGEPLRSIVLEAMRIAAEQSANRVAAPVFITREGVEYTVLDRPAPTKASQTALDDCVSKNRAFMDRCAPTPKDWRDVPVTAGMLVSVCNLPKSGDVYAVGESIKRVARRLAEPDELRADNVQHGKVNY